MLVKYIPEEALQTTFADALSDTYNCIPTCTDITDYYRPYNQFMDAWCMYCMGGEL